MAYSPTVDSATAIRCGEFVESVGDSVNANEGPFLHFPLYGKTSLFSRCHVPSAKSADAAPTRDTRNGNAVGWPPASRNYAYCITRYIYCTVEGVLFWQTGTAWIGYIAESSAEETRRLGRRDIIVAIRGTTGMGEWIKNIDANLASFPFVQTPSSGAMVHEGFLSIYTSASTDLASKFGKLSMREQIHEELLRLFSPNYGAVSDNKTIWTVHITVAGHSLGGALATLVACDVGCNIAVKSAPDVTVSAITFGAPSVGNDRFKKNLEEHTDFIWRFRNIGDLVPYLPFWWPFVQAGTELVLDWTCSPYVSSSIRAWCPFTFPEAHNLELYMHVIAAQKSGAVYAGIPEGLLPEVPEVPANFAERGDNRTSYFVTYICGMSAWDNEDRDLLRQELDDVKEYLKEDQQVLEQYLREVAYIGNARDKGAARNSEPPVHRSVAGVHGSIARLRSRQELSFDQRDYCLLNKNANLLKPEYSIPENWLVHANKDMVLDLLTNEWLPRKDRAYDIPTPDNPEYN